MPRCRTTRLSSALWGACPCHTCPPAAFAPCSNAHARARCRYSPRRARVAAEDDTPTLKKKLELVVDERRNHAPAAPADPVVNRDWDDELPNGYVGRTNMNP